MFGIVVLPLLVVLFGSLCTNPIASRIDPQQLPPVAAIANRRTSNFAKRLEESEKKLGDGEDHRAWKWGIRARVWDDLEASNMSAPPFPAHNRIPNFRGAEEAAKRMTDLPEFRRATLVSVASGAQQSAARYETLAAGKRLLVPHPGLRDGSYSLLDPEKIDADQYHHAVTQTGVEELGEPIDEYAQLTVDLVVIGAVAVNPTSGARLGRGVGFGDLEYGMLQEMDAINDRTPVVATVHEHQLAEDIPVESMLQHDVPVDIICTPNRTIRTYWPGERPSGIYWEKVSPQTLQRVQVLMRMKQEAEDRLEHKLPTGPEEPRPPPPLRTGFRGRGGRGRGPLHAPSVAPSVAATGA
mmetsp:Transcript_4398/g.12052  ORF Transcript_4398/g.12052 Transcript_4398/m.12052 type:complete len:354 (-) Transcript_4398:86-1147(-)